MNIKGVFASIALAFGLVSSPAYSYVLLDDTDVGNLDEFVSETTELTGTPGGSGTANEEEWASIAASSAADEDITLVFANKFEEDADDPDNERDFKATDTTDIVAHRLLTQPSYFLVKDGQKHVLFKNDLSDENGFDWAVFSMEHFGFKDDIQLSHLTEFNGNDIPVPEPGTALLIATGVFGLVVSRKRMKKEV